MLSPLLFVLYLNSYIELCNESGCQGVFIDEYFTNLMMLLYADDIAQVSDLVGRLQHQINTLQKICNLSGMKINKDKTQIVVFRNGGPLRANEKWFYNGNEIKMVTYYKYLGLFYSSRLNWSYAVKNLCIQSQKSVNMLKRLIGRCQSLPMNIIFEIFDTTILPVLSYASEIWGYKKYDEIEKVQLRFCKYLLGVGNNTTGHAVLGEVGRYPIFITTYTKCIKYWIKLIEMENGCLAKSSYLMLLTQCENCRENWVSYVKDILFRYGFGVTFVNQGVGDTQIVYTHFLTEN